MRVIFARIIFLKTSQYNLRLQKIITLIAVILFLVKIFAWYLTNSVAIFTDAMESIVNVVAAFIGVYSLYVSAKPKDQDHPYGHGKVEFLSAAVEGTLIMVAGVIVIYKATVSVFVHPVEIRKLDAGIILVAATALINFVAGTICLRIGKKNNSLALIASGKHLRTDTWSTLGIITGLVLLYLTNQQWLDSLVAVIFSLLIIYTGYRIIRTSIAGIMDEADIVLLKKMVALLNANRKENWIDLHNLRLIKYGGTLHVDCHLTVPWYLSVREAHSEIEALSALVRNEFGETVELFVHSDDCREFSCSICYKKDCLVRQHEFENRIEWTIDNIIKDSKHRIQTMPKVA